MKKNCEYCEGDAYQKINDALDKQFKGAEYCPYCGRFVGKNTYHVSEPPKITIEDDGILGDREETHPAYAQLVFSRQSGGHGCLYGSAIKHQETISMRISPSRKLSCKYFERYFSENIPYIEVRMSQSQFAQAITSMNMGSGVPVTLETLRGKRMPNCEEESVSEIANRGLVEKIEQFTDKITSGEKRINEIVNKKGSILKKDREVISNIYQNLITDLRYNIPFLHECMIEAYDKSATSAKADIEAFYNNAIRQMGMDALNQKKLDYEVNEDDRLQITDDEYKEILK